MLSSAASNRHAIMAKPIRRYEGNRIWVPLVLTGTLPEQMNGHGITLVPLGAIMCGKECRR